MQFVPGTGTFAFGGELTQGSQHCETSSGDSSDWAVAVNDDIQQRTRIILPKKYEDNILLRRRIFFYLVC